MIDEDKKKFVLDVRLIVLDLEDRLLLLKRNSPSGFGLWNPPGGKIDYGVSKREVCKNELEEETGLIASVNDLRSFYNAECLPNENDPRHYLTTFYHVMKYTGDVKINEESSDFAWVSALDIYDYEIAFDFDKGINNFYSKYWYDKM